jgi:uncharacterized protein YdeI (YjbR/CyaY-like superfamily)
MLTGHETRFLCVSFELRAWLEQHHARKSELWIGFDKKSSVKPSIPWAEAVHLFLGTA